jgi:hypothetical protein
MSEFSLLDHGPDCTGVVVGVFDWLAGGGFKSSASQPSRLSSAIKGKWSEPNDGSTRIEQILKCGVLNM